MFAKYDAYKSCFLIYAYDKKETGFELSTSMFKLQESEPSTNHSRNKKKKIENQKGNLLYGAEIVKNVTYDLKNAQQIMISNNN